MRNLFAKTTGKEFLIAGRPVVGVSPVSRPTMTVYPPNGKNTGAAVVVFPGGGYLDLAIDLESTEVCDWLTAKGITCVLLKYRVPGEPGYRKPAPYPKSGPYPESPMALEDAQKMRRGRWGWCAFTRRSGTLIHTRLGCSGFRQADILWRR